MDALVFDLDSPHRDSIAVMEPSASDNRPLVVRTEHLDSGAEAWLEERCRVVHAEVDSDEFYNWWKGGLTVPTERVMPVSWALVEWHTPRVKTPPWQELGRARVCPATQEGWQCVPSNMLAGQSPLPPFKGATKVHGACVGVWVGARVGAWEGGRG